MSTETKPSIQDEIVERCAIAMVNSGDQYHGYDNPVLWDVLSNCPGGKGDFLRAARAAIEAYLNATGGELAKVQEEQILLSVSLKKSDAENERLITALTAEERAAHIIDVIGSGCAITHDIDVIAAIISEAERSAYLRGAKDMRDRILRLLDQDEEGCVDLQWGMDRNSAVAQQTAQQIEAAIRSLPLDPADPHAKGEERRLLDGHEHSEMPAAKSGGGNG